MEVSEIGKNTQYFIFKK